MGFKKSVMLVVAALLTVASSVLSTQAQSGSSAVRVYQGAPAYVTVPEGSRIVDASGRPVPVLATSTAAGSDIVRPSLLQPGRYGVVSPRDAVGGSWLPGVSSFVVTADVLDWFSPLGEGSSPMPVLLAALAMLGAAASALPISLLVRRIALGVWAGASTGWVVTGSVSSVSALAWAAFAAAAIAVGLAHWSLGRSPLPRLAAFSTAALAAAAALAALALPGTAFPAATAAVVSASAALGVIHGASARATLRRALQGAVALTVVVLAVVTAAAFLPNAPSQYSRTQVTLEECAQLVKNESPAGVECYRALAARLAASLPAERAGEEVVALSEARPDVRPDAVCRFAGEAMSSAAARWGPDKDDPKELFVSLSPVCDYSSMHGIVSALVADLPLERIGEEVAQFCNQPSPDSARLPDYEYVAQCWQGAGIMLARRFAFAPELFEVCKLAPFEGEGNCPDGAIRELVDEMARARLGSEYNLVPEGVTVQSLCQYVYSKVAAGCYRYIGEEVRLRGGTQAEGVDAVQAACQSGIPSSHETQCWYSVGMVAARSLNDSPADQVMSFSADRCAVSPSPEALEECLVGATNAVISRDGVNADLDLLCSWYPEQARERLCESASFYKSHLSGADSTGIAQKQQESVAEGSSQQ